MSPSSFLGAKPFALKNYLEFQCSEHPVHCFVYVLMIVVVMILLAISQNNPCLEKTERILTKIGLSRWMFFFTFNNQSTCDKVDFSAGNNT